MADPVSTNKQLDFLPPYAAYQKVRDEIHAVGTKVEPFNLDIIHVAARSLAVSRIAKGLRDEAVVHLPTFDVTTFDRLPTYARALLFLYMPTKARRARKTNVREFVARLTHIRGCLLADLDAVGRRVQLGTLNYDFGGNRTYTELIQDVSVLVVHLKNHWSLIEGKTGLQLSDLDQADQLADEFVSVLGCRKEPIYAATERALERAQAFTLVVRTYEQVRRAVSFLRWDDRDALAPSLYSGRFKRRRKKKSSAPTQDPSTRAEPELEVDRERP